MRTVTETTLVERKLVDERTSLGDAVDIHWHDLDGLPRSGCHGVGECFQAGTVCVD
jgi:hypothetical protein